MSKNYCKKALHSKDRAAAEATTLRNKQVRLYRQVVKHPNNQQALEAFIQAVYPERVKDWLLRVQP